MIRCRYQLLPTPTNTHISLAVTCCTDLSNRNSQHITLLVNSSVQRSCGMLQGCVDNSLLVHVACCRGAWTTHYWFRFRFKITKASKNLKSVITIISEPTKLHFSNRTKTKLMLNQIQVYFLKNLAKPDQNKRNLYRTCLQWAGK